MEYVHVVSGLLIPHLNQTPEPLAMHKFRSFRRGQEQAVWIVLSPSAENAEIRSLCSISSHKVTKSPISGREENGAPPSALGSNFARKRTKGRTDGRTDGLTDGQRGEMKGGKLA